MSKPADLFTSADALIAFLEGGDTSKLHDKEWQIDTVHTLMYVAAVLFRQTATEPIIFAALAVKYFNDVGRIGAMVQAGDSAKKELERILAERAK